MKKRLFLFVIVAFTVVSAVAQEKLLTVDEIFSPDPKVRAFLTRGRW